MGHRPFGQPRMLHEQPGGVKTARSREARVTGLLVVLGIVALTTLAVYVASR